MKSPLLLAFLWGGSLVGAWLLGSRSAPDAPPPPVADPAAAPTPVVQAPVLSGAPTPSVEQRPSTPPPKPAGGSTPVPPALDLAGTPEEAQDKLLAFARARLAEGPAGHLAFLKSLDSLLKDERLEAVFGGDGDQAARFIYPWLKFGVEHEGEVVDLTETLIRTMATDPSALEGFEKNTLEVFLEGFAPVLPAVVPEERLGRLREYAKTILETPEASQPESIRKSRRRVERALAAWAPLLSSDEAVARLESGDLEPAEALVLLRRIAPEALRDVDVVAVLGPLVEQGDHRVFRVLPSLSLDRAHLAGLDARLVSSAASKDPWWIGRYLSATGRGRWAAARGVVDQGLRSGGAGADAFAGSLASLSERPPAEYVREALLQDGVTDQTKTQLRAAFSLR